MSVSVQSQPGLTGFGQMGSFDPLAQMGQLGQFGQFGQMGQMGQLGLQGLQGLSPQTTADIQAKLTEVVMQMLQLLINEIMKATRNLQNQQPGQLGGGGGPSGVGGAGGPHGASNAYKPSGDDQAPQTYAPPPQASPPVSNGYSPTPNVGEVSGGGNVGGKGPSGMPAELWQGCQEAAKKTGVDPYILAAQMEKESQFGKGLSGSPSAGDGLMQVEPSTRQAYAGKFEQKMGHAYDHGNTKDQIAMAGVILADKGGDATNMLQKYNGGDNWTPGTTDSYGREIKANEYASTVLAKAQQMKAAG